MVRKIFVSYKYADCLVAPIAGQTTCRNYVDKIVDKLGDSIIYKGEDDDDLSGLTVDAIKAKLKKRLYDSTVTLVLISKGMKTGMPERKQWIPWEISYSLKEYSRDDRTSKSNGILAVIIPDETHSESYYWKNNTCSKCLSSVTSHYENKIFQIIHNNKFNHKSGKWNCEKNHYTGNHYIISVSWGKFISNPDLYIEQAAENKENVDDYKIQKEITV